MGITLYYFNAWGLAEPIRMILTYGGEKFDEVRIPLDSMPPSIPPEMRAKLTWGQVPVVEFDGKKLAQSLAITRYFAKKHGLVPIDDFEAALCDEYANACKDFGNLWSPVVRERDKVKRMEKAMEAAALAKSRYLSVFNEILEKNGKYLVGNSLTWADIYLAYIIKYSEHLTGVSILPEYPALKTHNETIFAIPGIRAWVDKRPKSKF